MKSITKFAAMLLVCLVTLPTFSSSAYAGPVDPVTAKNERSAEVMRRLEDIRGMDRSQMSSTEKQELRKELKGMKKQAKSGGIYLSIGAVIIIILLLILLL